MVNWPWPITQCSLPLCNSPGAISDPFLQSRWEGGVRNRDVPGCATETSRAAEGRGQLNGRVGSVDPYAGSFATSYKVFFSSRKLVRHCPRNVARKAS